jgi:hypothetical protein
MELFSSSGVNQVSVELVREHDLFLEALAKGKVITTAFLKHYERALP